MQKRVINARLIVIFSILIVLVVIIILASTMFNVTIVTVQFSDTNQPLVLSKQEIEASCNIYKGQNLLFLSKDRVIKTVERSSAYAKNVQAERIFPNQLTIYVSERTEVFTIRFDTSEGVRYFMYDENAVYLRNSVSNAGIGTVQEGNIKIEGISERMEDDSSEVVSNVLGQAIVLKDNQKITIICQLIAALKSFGNYTERELIKFIPVIRVSNPRQVVLQTDAGATIRLSDQTDDIDGQIQMAIGTWNKWQTSDISKTKRGQMVISAQKDSEGKTVFTASYEEMA